MSESAPSGIGQMEAQASETILVNAETARIEADRSSALADAEAIRTAAVAAAEAQKAADSAALEADVSANHAATFRKQESAQKAQVEKTKSIETRSNSAEVSALNDRAELELFGSKNATFTDPKTGEVIASPEKPMIGKLEEIATNPKYGTTEELRNNYLNNYKDDLESLQKGGLELAQAKLVLDLREADIKNNGKLTGKLIAEDANSQSVTEASEKADNLYDKKDAARLKLIKDEGVFTVEEYNNLLKSKSTKKSEGAVNTQQTDVEETVVAEQSENPFASAPVAGTQTEGTAPKSENPFDKPPVVTATKELTEEDRKIRSYVNAEGKPLAGFNELNNELAKKVEAGDETDWNNLVQTLRDAVKYDAGNEANTRLKLEGETVEDRLKSFEAYASMKYKELKAKQPKDSSDEVEPIVIPEIVELTPNPATPEAKKRRGRKIAAGLVAAGLLLGAAFGLKKAMDSDDNKGKVSTEQTTTTTSPTDNADLPGNPTSGNPTPEAVDGSDKDTTATLGYDISNAERSAYQDAVEEAKANGEHLPWTWEVAHNVAPGHEDEVVQKGIDDYNTAHKADANYSPFALGKATINGKSTTVIKNGTGHIVSPPEMEEINMRMLAE